MLVGLGRGLSKIWKSSNIQSALVNPILLEGENERVKEVLISMYKKVLTAYKENDFKNLQRLVEPGLYRDLVEDYNEVRKKGGVFEVSEPKLEIGFCNFSLTVGVNIDRSLNFEKKTYADILTGEDLGVKMEVSDEDLNNLKNMKLFIHPKAPTNAITSLIMRCNQGVRVLENGKKNEIDWFWVKFECEVLRSRAQAQTMLTGEFQSLLNMLGRKEFDGNRIDWVITDINNALAGNPYIIE